ncbi:S6 family peptidase [Escherichia marmotae]|uniref:S6 family peptidase n=1 Tax=Escherichia marmotae TaxID=1499973 RepID=UPI00165060E0|nr:S6 family peptidase [Escherichia marmotae]HAI8688345.1 autotransporter outer membrane beta-barrel domain-containing protein [Escherichia coli]MDQ9324497.1 autotransporter outer membrane beta-barrel domain-containing protein [Escherichia marmotae]MEC9572911.1 S6 family peptidase [Escherichia marmotae]MEC9745102.1 S6 family peptidase [Escherichia marmotae]MEC9904832.1 S6 family peptidase [Escherichia marmotae]
MNFIYSLKFNKKRELVVASEISGGIKKSTHSKVSKSVIILINILAAQLYSPLVHASVVGMDIPYQTYRDFAENKGAFSTGALNIPLYDKQGNLYSTLSQAPMIDFSSVDRGLSVATLVAPQYIVSVKHNGGYKSVKFGYNDDNNYILVDRNNGARDFHTPRLNKIVTEVAPSEVTDAGTATGTYKNQERFPVFYRVGTGTQYVKGITGKLTSIAGGYTYKTGGTVGVPAISDWSIVSNPGNTYAVANGPMASYGTPGDSGSPLFAWDTQRNKWVLVAVLNSYAGNAGKTNWFTVIPVNEVNANIEADTDAPVTPMSTTENINWTYDISTGTGKLTQGADTWEMHGRDTGSSAVSFNHGKDLSFENTGTVMLKDTVNQGAGTLTFNGDYTVKPESNQTWIGGGIIVNDDHTVDWQVNGVAGDSLHKLGTGTLNISGTGINPGTLSVGDGTVVLAQKPDSNGQVQAFESASIVSGRPTLVLSDSHQMNPDNIKWGYRGGKLDINGNDLTFHALNAADEGAILTNSSSLSTVNLDFNSTNTTTPVTTMFHGYFTGNVNVKNNATSNVNNTFVVDGGIKTPTGSMTQQGGRLFFQGHPVIHAVSTQTVANKLKALGDDSVLTQPVSFTQSDWQTRQFNLKSLDLNNAAFYLARNAELTTTINANNSTVTLGSEDLYIDTNDGNGVKTTPVEGQSIATTSEDQSSFIGNVYLRGRSTLNIGYGTNIIGDINAWSDLNINFGSGTKQSSATGISYTGNIYAPEANVSMNNTSWALRGESWLGKTTISNSQLTVSTDGKTSSNITVVDKLTADNNTLYVTPTRPLSEMSFNNIPLITAKRGVNNTSAFKTVTQQVGFHSMTPKIEVVNVDGTTQWRLKGFDVQSDSSALNEGQRLTNTGVKNFLTEVNNLNRRMGDLRDTKGETGAWARLMNSSGSGHGGLSDSHVHLQVGADRKHHFEGGDFFTGVMMTFTDSKASAESYQGKTRSVGGGLYASTLFDSGVYVDVIGKYVHHSNDYLLQTMGLKADDTAHSWYLGAETGWRYQWKPDVFIEPQVELVYGTLSGNTFNWQYNGMDISMKRKTANPLIGRTGVEFGKTLDGHDWQVTAKAGLSYQFDLRNSGTTTYRDFAGESTVYNGKDGRMLANIGIDTRIKDNTRIGLTVEKSAFGKYNVDNAINANIRYSF